MKTLFILFLEISVLFLFYSCNDRIYRSNMSYLYDYEQPYYSFQHTVFHRDTDTSVLFLQIPHQAFLYKRHDETSCFKTKIEVTCNLMAQNSSLPFYTKKVLFEDSLHYKKNINQIFLIPIYTGDISENCFLQCIIHDVNKNQKIIFLDEINKQPVGNRQYFLIKNSKSQILFSPYLTERDTFQLIVSSAISPQQLQVNYYTLFRDIAKPPFANDESSPVALHSDSIFYIAHDLRKTDLLTFKKKGVYHVIADSSFREGYTIFIMDKGYPEVVKPYQMVQPLKYLMSHKDYSELEHKKNTQETIEEFWLRSSSDEEDARNKIREFYTRVKYANIFFSSYKEGWRTDRGMIYIVFGAPANVYKSENSEIWGYGFDKHYNSVDFKFLKAKNPFTSNDYTLIRIPNYKDSWYRAVEKWIN